MNTDLRMGNFSQYKNLYYNTLLRLYHCKSFLREYCLKKKKKKKKLQLYSGLKSQKLNVLGFVKEYIFNPVINIFSNIITKNNTNPSQLYMQDT